MRCGVFAGPSFLRGALILKAVLLSVGLALFLACAGDRGTGGHAKHRERVVVSSGWLAMGTFFEADLRVWPEEVEKAEAWLDWSRGEIERLEKIYSRHDPDSELSSLNRKLVASEILVGTVELGPELEAILFDSIEVWEVSGGAFDCTIGPLVDVWTRAAESGSWPSVENLRQAKRRVGSQHLLLTGSGKLGLTTKGMRIDLDGISKGAVMDRLRERLAAILPDAAALISFGQSSILALGSPGPEGDDAESGWLLEIRSSRSQGGRLGTVRLRDQALSMSSSIGSVSKIADEIVSHVVDPRTGATVEGTLEAVVVADRAALADGWSTALLVLGAKRETIRAIGLAGLEAAVFESGGRNAFSEGWEALGP